MQTVKWMLLASISVLAAACTQDPGTSAAISDTEREQLATFGIVGVVSDGRSFELTGRDGPIGEVRLDDATMDATFAGNHVRTRHGETAECNSIGVSLADGVSPTARSVLAPCDDVLRVAAILFGADTTPPAAAAFGAGGCTFLGANIYCSGTTAVTSFDDLCYNNDGSSQRVVTTTYFDPDSWYCAD